MTDTEQGQLEEQEIDAEADAMEEEMGHEIDARGDRSYLLPWLIPVAVIAAFILLVVFAVLRK